MGTYKIAFSKMDKDVTPSGLEYLDIPKMSFEVNVTIDDKIYKEIQSDGLLLQDMQEAVKEVYDQTCGSIKGRYAAFDKLFASWIDKGLDKKDIEKHVDGLNKSVANDVDVGEKAADMAVENCWKKYIKNKKEYTKYKIKVVVKITGAVAGLVTSITLTATSAFSGGASFAFGIVGMVKSVVTIAREIRSACADIETAQSRLQSDLGKIKKADSQLAVRANEYSAAILKQFLDVSQPSIKSCSAQMDVIEKKLAGIQVNTHEASKILNSMLDDKDKLKKDFMAGVKERYQKMVKQIPKGQIDSIEKALDVELTDGEKKIEEQIKHVVDMNAYFKDAEKRTEHIKKQVEAFEAVRTLDVKVFENILQFADLGLSVLDGNALAKAGNLESGIAVAAACFGYDKIASKALEGTILV